MTIDAWKQLADLYERYSQEWEVRADLRVRALATDRCVELGLGTMKHSPKFDREMMDFTVTQRNVGTMRELAAALVEACDFVDEANPTWASHKVNRLLGD